MCKYANRYYLEIAWNNELWLIKSASVVLTDHLFTKGLKIGN